VAGNELCYAVLLLDDAGSPYLKDHGHNVWSRGCRLVNETVAAGVDSYYAHPCDIGYVQLTFQCGAAVALATE
jgi:hypothetical protein